MPHHTPSPRAHHERDVLLRRELKGKPSVARVTHANLRCLSVALQTVVITLSLCQNVAALSVTENIPSLPDSGR